MVDIRQNYFLDQRIKHRTSVDEPIRKLVQTIPRLRKAGVTIIWVKLAWTEEEVNNLPPAVCRAFFPTILGSEMGTRDGQDIGRAMILGEWNTEIYDELKQVLCTEDPVIVKSR